MNKTLIKSVLFQFVLITIFSSCHDREREGTIFTEALAMSDTLSTHRIVKLEGQSLLLNPRGFENVGDKYLVTYDFLSENFFKVFKLPKLNFLYAWGHLGQGPEPDEFPTHFFYLNAGDDKIYVYEGTTQQLKTIRITDDFVEKIDETKLFYAGQIDPLNRVRRMNDSLYFVDYGTMYGEGNREHIALRPGDKDSLFTFGTYPPKEMDELERSFEYAKLNTSSPDGKKFAAFYFYYNMFNLYDDSGKRLKHVVVDDPLISKRAVQNAERFIYRTSAWSSNNYIYLIAQNRDRDLSEDNADFSMNTSLEIWNWNGEPVYRTMLDRQLDNFTVSEEHGKIYAYSNIIEDSIFEYDISTVLENIEKKP